MTQTPYRDVFYGTQHDPGNLPQHYDETGFSLHTHPIEDKILVRGGKEART